MIWVHHVPEDVIQHAKEMTAKFDAQKTHEKINSDKNFIGYLGEYYVNKFFVLHQLQYEWVNFIKPDASQPDFKIGGRTLDVKTTMSGYLFLPFNEPKFDYYLVLRYSEDSREGFHRLASVGYITKKSIKTRISRGNIEIKTIQGRKIYAIQMCKLMNIEKFTELMKKLGGGSNGGTVGVQGSP